jgi:hypothetical protein
MRWPNRLIVTVSWWTTLHQLQGLQNRQGNVDDPNYSRLIHGLILGQMTDDDEKLDFIFEEASGLGPTIAEQMATKDCGNRYLDVDPSHEERMKHALPKETCECLPIGPVNATTWAYRQLLDGHIRREEFWLKKIKGKDFRAALMVCGREHLLSFSFRLRAGGFEVEAVSYNPHLK